MRPERSLESVLEEMSVLNRVHMGLKTLPGESHNMTRGGERGRYAALTKLLDEHQQERLHEVKK